MKMRLKLFITAATAVGALLALVDPWPLKKKKDVNKKIKNVGLLNHETGEFIIIKLTEEEQAEMLEYDTMREFLDSLGEKYGFCMDSCSYTYSAEEIKINNYGNQENKEKGTVETGTVEEQVIPSNDDLATGVGD